MIPDQGKLSVFYSKWDVKQQRKNLWKQARYEALDYYKGNTKEYVGDYFSSSTLSKVPIGNVNITKRIIDRISLVYMTPPIRLYSNEDTPDYFVEKDLKLQRLERMTNLLDGVLVKPCWRIKPDGTGCIEYDLIMDYEPLFDTDPLNPYAIVYPIAQKAEVLDTTPEQFVYWDAENTFVFDQNGKQYTSDDNPDMVNPYGVLPFIECFRDGKPETDYLDTNASKDLVQTNLAINVAETNKNANIMFQSFGYLFVNGAGIDPQDKISIGQDKINFLGVDGSISIVSPPNAVPALDASIQSSYKMRSQNYPLPISFVEGSSQASGLALKLRNLELTDSRKSDVIRWKDIEYKLFELERLMVAVEAGKDTGDLEDVDFSESIEVLNDEEQRSKWEWELSKGLIELADIAMQQNPDLDREEAEELLASKKSSFGEEEEEKEPVNPLLEALAKPVGKAPE